MTTENPTPQSITDLTAKMKLQGVVKKIELYGALVDIGVERLGLLHISQLSENHVKNVSDIVKEGDTITVYVQDVDRQKGRINLTMLKPPAVTWNEIKVDGVFKGEVVRVEKFGAFVDFGAERPGLVHVSELAQGYVGDPTDVVKVGDEIEVKVIGVNRRKKQIDLSVRALEMPTMVEQDEPEEETPTTMEFALRQAFEQSGLEMPAQKQKSSKKRRNKKNKQRQSYDDIFERTLQQHAND